MKKVIFLLPLFAMKAEPALEYESQVREEFEAFEARVEEIRVETGTEDPDRLLPRLEARRSLWKAEAGDCFFERLHNEYWVERADNRNAYLFVEVDRTPEYVEMNGTGGNAVVRLYNDRRETLLRGRSSFTPGIDGEWVR